MLDPSHLRRHAANLAGLVTGRQEGGQCWVLLLMVAADCFWWWLQAASCGCWVEPRGLEPLTPCLQSRCATNCAMAPRRPGAASRTVSRAVSGTGHVVGGLGPEGLLTLTRLGLPTREDGGRGGQRDEHDLLHRDVPFGCATSDSTNRRSVESNDPK